MVLFFTFILPSQLFAEEGFYSNPHSPLPIHVWSATVGVANTLDGSFGVGSGVIVDVQHDHILVLTVAHNFIAPGKNTIDPQDMASAQIVMEFIGDFAKFDYQFRKIDSGIELVKVDVELDLALLKVRLNTGFQSLVNKISVPENCALKRGETLYAIGHPSVDLRSRWNGLIIDDPHLVKKRWSKGLYTGFAPERHWSSPDSPLLAGSYDCISGCSGGPVINAQGELLGIHHRSLAVETYPYFGNDWTLTPHSFFTPCETLKNFL